MYCTAYDYANNITHCKKVFLLHVNSSHIDATTLLTYGIESYPLKIKRFFLYNNNSFKYKGILLDVVKFMFYQCNIRKNGQF